MDFTVEAMGLSVDLGSATMIPVTVGLDVHLLKNSKVDLYIGPLLSYTLWSNLDTPVGAVESVAQIEPRRLHDQGQENDRTSQQR